MKHSELLAHAKSFLSNPAEPTSEFKSPYICNALDRVVLQYGIDLLKTAQEIKNHINKCLRLTPDGRPVPELQDKPTLSVGMWLYNACGVDYGDITPSMLYAYRLQWIDILIKDYQEKGM